LLFNLACQILARLSVLACPLVATYDARYCKVSFLVRRHIRRWDPDSQPAMNTGSNPVSPTSSIPTQQRAVAPRTDLPRSVCLRLAAGRFARPGSDNATSARRCVHPLGRAEHLLHTISCKRRQPRPSSQLYGIRVPQAVHHSEAARRPRVVVALHSDHCRRRPDLGYLRE
jgi:hypothetical protein